MWPYNRHKKIEVVNQPEPEKLYSGPIITVKWSKQQVWPNFFLIMFSLLLKGLNIYYYLLSLQLDAVPCGGRKSLPKLLYGADYIFLLVLWDHEIYTEHLEIIVH